MSTPTSQDIFNAQTNLNNMIEFNQQFFSYGQGKIANAYALLAQKDDSDLGLQIGLNLLTNAMGELGGTAGFGGAIAGNFIASMVSQYAAQTPPSLGESFASIEERFENTSLQAGYDLEEVYANTETDWNKTYSGQLITPFSTTTISGSVSDLAQEGLFPSKDDPMFTKLLETATYALDQSIWSVLLKRFIITAWSPATEYKTKYYSEQDMENNAASFYGVNPAYYNTWEYEEARKEKNDAYWLTQHNIGTGASSFHDGSLNDNACNYLFIDSYDDVIINPQGLFHRKFVFMYLGIPTTSKYLNN